jgi:hypothetical protein
MCRIEQGHWPAAAGSVQFSGQLAGGSGQRTEALEKGEGHCTLRYALRVCGFCEYREVVEFWVLRY